MLTLYSIYTYMLTEIGNFIELSQLPSDKILGFESHTLSFIKNTFSTNCPLPVIEMFLQSSFSINLTFFI